MKQQKKKKKDKEHPLPPVFRFQLNDDDKEIIQHHLANCASNEENEWIELVSNVHNDSSFFIFTV